RHGSDADHARCLRCADQAGNRFNSRLGQSGEPKVQLIGIGRDYGRGSEYHGTGGGSRTHANVGGVAPMRRGGQNPRGSFYEGEQKRDEKKKAAPVYRGKKRGAKN